MQKLRIAVIGTGLIGRKHIEIIQQSDQFELSGIANPSSDSSDLVTHHHVKHFTSHRLMLDQLEINCAVIATSNETHEEIAADCLGSGITCLLEKPATHTLAAGLRLDALSSNPTAPKILVGHHRRHSPVLRTVKEMIQKQRFGEMVAFSGIWSAYKPDPYFNVPWRIGPFGGPIFINLIHEIDSIHALLGPIRSVAAIGGKKYRHHPTKETSAVIFEMASGVVGTVVLSDSAASPWSWERSTGENSKLFPPIDENSYRLLFEKGSLEFPRLKEWHQNPPDWQSQFMTSDTLQNLSREVDVFSAQLDHFAQVVRGNEQPLVSLRDGVKALQIAEIVDTLISKGGGHCDVPPLPWE